MCWDVAVVMPPSSRGVPVSFRWPSGWSTHRSARDPGELDAEWLDVGPKSLQALKNLQKLKVVTLSAIWL